MTRRYPEMRTKMIREEMMRNLTTDSCFLHEMYELWQDGPALNTGSWVSITLTHRWVSWLHFRSFCFAAFHVARPRTLSLFDSRDKKPPCWAAFASVCITFSTAKTGYQTAQRVLKMSTDRAKCGLPSLWWFCSQSSNIIWLKVFPLVQISSSECNPYNIKKMLSHFQRSTSLSVCRL